MVTHRDPSVLPSSNTDIKDINLIHPGSHTPQKSSKANKLNPGHHERSSEVEMETPYFDPEDGYTMATHVINLPDSSQPAVYQTTNPLVPIDRELVLGIARLERYVYFLTESTTSMHINIHISHPSRLRTPGSSMTHGATHHHQRRYL